MTRLIPYDPDGKRRPKKPQDDDPAKHVHYHYYDQRTFVQEGPPSQIGADDEEVDDEAERILAPWQKYALELIGAVSLLGLLAYFGGTSSTVTTNTVTEEVYPAAASTNVPAKIDDAQGASAAGSGSINTMAEGATAEQMLEEWSEVATGKRSINGFLLVNGSGGPGEGCNAHEGKHLLKFGAMLGGKSGAPISDYFGGTFLDIGAVVGGAYWYNNQDRVLITRRLELKQINGDDHKSLEDGAEKVEPLSPGIVLIKGVRFHECVLK